MLGALYTGTLDTVPLSVLPIYVQGQYYYSHSTDEEMKAQRDLATYPRSHSQQIVELGVEA